MLRRGILASLLLLLPIGLAHAEVKVNNHPLELGSLPVFKAGPAGGLYFAYYSKSDNNALYVKRLDKDPDQETMIAFENMKGEFLDLSFLKDSMALTWRPKKGDGKKYLYVQRSEDDGKSFKAPAILNSTSDVLNPISTATDGKERLCVVWLDEREKKHRLYLNCSTDGGRSFLKEDVVLTPDFKGENLPRLLMKDERVDLFFVGLREGEKQGIFHKYSSDGGKTWSGAGAVELDMDWGPSMLVPVRAGDAMLLFWSGGGGLYAAASADGKTWNKIAFKDTEGKEVGRIDVKTRGSEVFLVASYQTRFVPDEKPSVYFYKSADKGATWTGPQKLNTNEYSSTSSAYPSVGVSDDGKTILVAWQDHRDIRPSIYINYSKDGGDTWLKEDRLFEKKGGKYNSSHPMIVNYRDSFPVIWYRFTDDQRIDADMYMEEAVIK